MEKVKNVPEVRFPGFTDAWEQRKLSDIAEINPKSVIPDVFEYVDLESVIGTEMISHKRVEKSSAPLRAQRLAKKGDVFYQTVRPYQRNNYYFKKSDDTYVFSTGYAQIRSKFDGYFILSILQTDNFVNKVLEKCTGSSYPAINSSDLSDIEIKVPKQNDEFHRIGSYFSNLDNLISLHQREYDKYQDLKKTMLQKMFPRNGALVPEVRFPGFTDAWEQRKFGELYEKVCEKNDLTYGTDKIISVAQMYFREDDSRSDEDYLKTYNVFKLGDIAFEGNKSKNFAHGRFVENTIGNGIVSHVFKVFRPKMQYDLQFWKYAINNEQLMGKILTRSTKASTMMTDLVDKDFLRESFLVPSTEEQQRIGAYLEKIDNLISLHQREGEQLEKLKKTMLQKMFPRN